MPVRPSTSGGTVWKTPVAHGSLLFPFPPACPAGKSPASKQEPGAPACVGGFLPVPLPCPGPRTQGRPCHSSPKHSQGQTCPSLLLPPGAQSLMGNCLHPVDPVSNDEDMSSFDFEDDLLGWNASYEAAGYNDNYTGFEAAAPCRSCSLLAASTPPLPTLAGALGALAAATMLLALLRPLARWRVCPGRSGLAQVAAGSALFSTTAPLLSPGLGAAHSRPALCHLARLAWYSAAFAQALLLASRACLGPSLGAGWGWGRALGLSVGLWGGAVLLGLPVTLASKVAHGLCTETSPRGALQLLHTAACVAAFVLLPLGLLGARGLARVLGRGPCPRADVLWVWFLFWGPHGVLRGLDFLVKSRLWVLPSCPALQALDVLLELAEALAILHCVATPLLLALLCHQATHAAPATPPRPASQSPGLDTLGAKS